MKLKNREAVLEALIEQIKEFQCDLNKYQTDVYLYIKDGNGTVDTFTNVGGNSWLDDDHFTIYTDKEHTNTIMDELTDGESFSWLIDELESNYNLSGIKEKAYKDITAAMDADDLDEEGISTFDDLDLYDVEMHLKKNYSTQIEDYYKKYFVPDCCMDYISEAAEHVLDEFEETHNYVVLDDDREFVSKYDNYDDALKAAKDLGNDAIVTVWLDD